MIILITGAAGSLAHQFLPLLCSGRLISTLKIIFLKLFFLQKQNFSY